MDEAITHLLIVEDDHSVATAIAHWARRRGFTAELALNLEECRRALYEGSFDLVFIDLRLPNGVDGLDLAADLIAENPERPVVLMTAYAQLESAQRAVGVGIFEYLEKPIEFEQFSDVVDRAIAHRRRLIASRNRHLKEAEQANDQLRRAFDDLQEKERLLAAYGGIARLARSSLELDEIIDNVGRHILQAGIFPSLMIALVDEDSQTVEVVRSLVHTKVHDGVVAPDSVLTSTTPVVGISYALDDPNVTAVTARTGRMQIVEPNDDGTEQSNQEISFFIPIKTEERVLGVLATASQPEEKSSMISQIETMMPMLDQFAGALDHARLYRDSLDYAAALSRINEELEREIVERKRAEEAVVRLERLGALGEMSAGVSHNLNNILTGVLGPAEMVEMLTEDPIVLREVGLIRTSALRARDLVARLHQAVRGESDQLGPVKLNKTIEEAVSAGRPRWKDEPESRGHNVQVHTSLTPVADVSGTVAGLHDIVLNLLFNAVDALPEGGDIWIETRPTEHGVLVSVRDNGVGMTDEVRRRVFDPFFTTKAHVGTGLGLSTVYGQVTRWGGEISVDSVPGEGTTFTIVFRGWEGVPVRQAGEAEKRTRKRGRILIVEDEEMVREVVFRMLVLHHEVETVSSGEAALAVFESGKFDVALIDLGMPGLPGDKVAERLRDVDASISTVLMTGWSLKKDDARLAAFDDHLQKPFTEFDELLDVIGRAIARHESRLEQKVG